MSIFFGKSDKTLLFEQEYNDAKTWFDGYYASQTEDVKISISVIPGDKGIPSEQLLKYNGIYFNVAHVVNAFNNAESSNHPAWKQAWKQECINIHKKNMVGGRKRIFRKKKSRKRKPKTNRRKTNRRR